MASSCPICKAELTIEDVRQILDSFRLTLDDFPAVLTQAEKEKAMAAERNEASLADEIVSMRLRKHATKALRRYNLIVKKEDRGWVVKHPRSGNTWLAIPIEGDPYHFEFQQRP